MQLPVFHVDAFTTAPFGGNPAAVCPLPHWLADDLLRRIAAENNLSETAFFVRDGDTFKLRWFTPAVEVDLCGHATLASAFVLFNYLDFQEKVVRFTTQSGLLTVLRSDGERLEMDFPTRAPIACKPHPNLVAGLGAEPQRILAARDYFCIFASEVDVRNLKPDFGILKTLDKFAVIATAPGQECDFVSRFFAPAQGIDEDPVTGSAHCSLTPYWSRQLAKAELVGHQISPRGGVVYCRDQGERTAIGGYAVLFSRGLIELP